MYNGLKSASNLSEQATLSSIAGNVILSAWNVTLSAGSVILSEAEG